MSLVKCTVCNQKISSLAEKCPNCGHPVNLLEINSKSKSDKKKGCLIIIVVILFLSIIISQSSNNDSLEDSNNSVDTSFVEIDSIQNKKTQDSINLIQEKEEAAFLKTKAGKIYKKHPDWSKDDCEKVAKNRVWIGMKYEMLIYERGKPNTINTSNYGYGNEYQCCWDDYTPRCFYMKEDNIIHSYN